MFLGAKFTHNRPNEMIGQPAVSGEGCVRNQFRLIDTGWDDPRPACRSGVNQKNGFPVLVFYITLWGVVGVGVIHETKLPKFSPGGGR